MQFEYDPEKSRVNKEKHGIDFEDAKKIWDGNYVEIPVRSNTENRFAVIGKIVEIFWTAIITYRKKAIRLISVRRSREKEEIIYEEYYRKDE
ncbi:MAG: BrnT family toxin [Leptospiraceae bacterium]|nr:BrnT family toxin [Leptospiraceae bacterium]